MRVSKGRVPEGTWLSAKGLAASIGDEGAVIGVVLPLEWSDSTDDAGEEDTEEAAEEGVLPKPPKLNVRLLRAFSEAVAVGGESSGIDDEEAFLVSVGAAPVPFVVGTACFEFVR